MNTWKLTTVMQGEQYTLSIGEIKIFLARMPDNNFQWQCVALNLAGTIRNPIAEDAKLIALQLTYERLEIYCRALPKLGKLAYPEEISIEDWMTEDMAKLTDMGVDLSELMD